MTICPTFSKVTSLQSWTFVKLCSGVDINGDQAIDYDEFIILITKKIILNAVESKYR